jgi:gluconolactonase
MRYDVAADGTISNGRVFYDLADAKEQGIPDGMKVDTQGNIYAAGPEGVWVFSRESKHLGTIQPGETAAKCGCGDDGKTLYITASTGVCSIRINVPGLKPLYQVYQ